MADEIPLTPALQRRDMQGMLSIIQGARLVSMARETAISQVQGWLLGRFWFGAIIAAITVILILLICPAVYGARNPAAFLCGIVVVLFTARVGALISIGRRLKDEDVGLGVSADGIYALASIGSGTNGLAIALMSSNAFGLVVYALFASGLPSALGLSGGIAPVFRASLEDLNARAKSDYAAAKQADKALATCREALATEPLNADGNEQTIDGNTTDESIGGTDTNTSALDNTSSAVESCDEEELDQQAAAASMKVSRGILLAATSDKPVVDPLSSRGSSEPMLVAMKSALGLADVSDLFKLLIWAFIAGFFEKFVPDMLDSLAARGREAKKK